MLKIIVQIIIVVTIIIDSLLSLSAEEKNERMQTLVEKQQLEGLTAAEKEEAELLSQFFNRIMLVRAKATILLRFVTRVLGELG